MRKRAFAMLGALFLLTASLLAGCGSEPKPTTGLATLKSEGDMSFDYILYTPEGGKELPVVIYFHGFGETETVTDTKTVATLSGAEEQAQNPCYILAPAIEDNVYLAQSDRDKLYSEIKNIVDKLASQGKINPERIYVCGNSFGGLATVEFAEKYPGDVAAAIVMCPALSYCQDSTTNLTLMKDVPTWFAHATALIRRCFLPEL